MPSTHQDWGENLFHGHELVRQVHQLRLPLHVPKHRGVDLKVLQPEPVEPPGLLEVRGGRLVPHELEVRLGDLTLDPRRSGLAPRQQHEDLQGLFGLELAVGGQAQGQPAGEVHGGRVGPVSHRGPRLPAPSPPSPPPPPPSSWKSIKRSHLHGLHAQGRASCRPRTPWSPVGMGTRNCEASSKPQSVLRLENTVLSCSSMCGV